ncbi:MAG: MBL fold metallo-hydrolase [Bacteroidia bacterium]|nr:MBL fold metallo-hydrolase [Bacteroidia bacterium]MDW8332592.1 MBL fold metallo-hydrolase [Bacteroidia bacterium]
MKITFLGTGTSQGVPVIACNCPVCLSDDPRDKRLRSSALVQTDERTFVIDTGPDFRAQMLTHRVRRLDFVLFTHAHKDHTAGMDDVRAFNYVSGEAMPVFATADTWNTLEREFSYIFNGHDYPGIPKIKRHLIDSEPFSALGVEVVPIPVLHYRMPVLGFRIGDFAYVTDASLIPESSLERLQNLDVLILNALRKEKHISHFNLEGALEVVRILRPRRSYFTHISHLMGRHADVSAELPENVHFAYDGLTIEV